MLTALSLGPGLNIGGGRSSNMVLILEGGNMLSTGGIRVAKAFGEDGTKNVKSTVETCALARLYSSDKSIINKISL